MGKPKDKYENRKEYHAEYYKKYKQSENYKIKNRAYMKAYRLRPENILKTAAVRTLNNAVRDGMLKRLPCVKCGKNKTEAHHQDYAHPLNVVWLCRLHHLEIHKATN